MDTPPNQNPSPNAGSTPGQNPNQAPNQPPSGSKPTNTGMAVLCYLGILIIIPFVTEAHKDLFVKYHIKQGLVLIILEVIASFIAAIPVLGWIVAPILWVLIVILVLIGLVNAANGRMKELPVIGKFAQNFHF